MKPRMKFFQPKTKSVFLPKIRRRPKKRSTFKFSSFFFSPKLREGQKKGLCPPCLCSNPLPKLQKEGPCRNFAYYFMLISILSWRPKGGAMAQWPPLNTPLGTLRNYDISSRTRLCVSNATSLLVEINTV